MASDLLEYFANLELNKRKVSRQGSDQVGSQVRNTSENSVLKPRIQQISGGKSTMSVHSNTTFLSILNNGCSRKGWTPSFDTIESNEISENFTVRCRVSDMVAYGKAKSKKAAKQLAARDILLQVVSRNELPGFDLGITNEEAVQNINKISARVEADDDIGAASAENWVGKLSELCSRVKISAPDYTYEDKSSSQGPLFAVTCAVGKVKTVGEAKQKKLAKALAAREMFSEAQENRVIKVVKDNSFSLSNFTDKKATNDACQDQKILLQPEKQSASTDLKETVNLTAVDSEKNPTVDEYAPTEVSEKSFIQLLDEEKTFITKIFAKQKLVFTVFGRSSAANETQCLLQLATPEKEIRVFPGWGVDVQQAKDCACNNAFSFAKVCL